VVDIDELEKRWKVYKYKSFLPYLIFIFGFIVIFLFVLVLMNHLSKPKEKKQIEKVVVKEEKKIIKPKNTVVKDKNATIKKFEKNKEKVIDKLLLEPSFDFIDRMQNDEVIYNEDVKDKKEVKKIIKKDEKPIKKVVQKTIKKSEKIEKKSGVKKVEEPKKIKIEKKQSSNDIDDVVKRFNKNNNPALSLFVARRYYEMGMYEKSYNYALITNELNNDIEDSWIIFAKSLVKLDEKDTAVKMLKKYIEYSSSHKASVLLNKIVTGKFK
jgi:tetratricopeptide (TPR) repeat protein